MRVFLGMVFFVSLFIGHCFAEITSVITFEDPPFTFQDAYGDGDRYVEGDYFVESVSTPRHHGSLIRFDPFDPRSLDIVPNNGTIHAGATYFSNVSIQRNDDAPFTLVSLDIGEYSEYASPPSAVTLVGHRFDGTTISSSLSLDGQFDGYGGIDDFQNYTLNWEDIVKLEFQGYVFSFDNVVMESIPEPTTLVLLGFGGLILRRRCRG